MVLSPGRGSAPHPSARTSEARTPLPRAAAPRSPSPRFHCGTGRASQRPPQQDPEPAARTAPVSAGLPAGRLPRQTQPLRPRPSAMRAAAPGLGAARRGGGSQLLSKVLQTLES